MNKITIPLYLKKEIFPYKNSSVTFSYGSMKKIQQFYQDIVNRNLLNINIEKSVFNSWDSYKIKYLFPEHYHCQLKFIYDKFLPLTKRTDYFCEMGCASGELTQFFSLHFEKVDAFDYSNLLLDSAKKDFNNFNIKNTMFQQADVTTYKYDKIYDNLSIMGVLTCILEDKLVFQAIKNASQAIKSNGYLLYKDYAQDTTKDYFFFALPPSPTTVARSKFKILSFFEKNDFELIEDIKFPYGGESFFVDNIEYPAYYSYGAIFRKK